MPRIVWWGVPVVVIGVLVVGRVQAVNEQKVKQKAEAGARRGAAPSVEIATAISRPIVEAVEAVGSVASEFTVDLSPRVTGRITYLQVREGDSVTAGQILARIDPTQANAQLLEGQANVNESRSRLAQAEATIQASEVQVEQNIRQAEAQVASSQAELTQARKGAEARLAAAEANVRTAESALTSAQAERKNRAAELTSSQATLRNEELRLRRVQSQHAKGYIAAQDVDDALAVVESAKAMVSVRQGEVESADADIRAAVARLESERTALTTTRASGKAEVDAAQARLEQSRSAVTAARANRAQTPANRQNVNALRAGVASMEAQLQSAAGQRADTELSSSVSGIVTQRSADPGTLATPGQPILRIEAIDSLFVNVSIPVQDSARVREGLPVSIKLDGVADEIRAKVDQVVPSANAQDRQFLVKIRVPNPKRQIRPGMFARVNIEISRADARVVIPSDAIRDGTVFVLDGEAKATRRPVGVGKQDANGVEIVNGLEPGDQVVVLSYSPVKDGGKVNITAERMADGTRKAVQAEKPADPKEKQS